MRRIKQDKPTFLTGVVDEHAARPALFTCGSLAVPAARGRFHTEVDGKKPVSLDLHRVPQYLIVYTHI
jgi:hypothetical protein